MKKLFTLIGIFCISSVAILAQNTTPCLTVAATSNSSVPVGKSIKLNVNPATGTATISANATITWAGSNGFTSSLKEPEITNATVAMSGIYTVKVVTGTCTATATTNVIVNVPCTIAVVASSNSPVCINGTLSLKSSGGMSSYQWFGPNNFSSTQQNPSITFVNAERSGVYQVRTTDANGCVGTASLTVAVQPPLTVTIAANNPVCVGGTLQLSASGGTTYLWSGPGGFTSTAATPTVSAMTAAKAGNYIVVASNANGCTGTAYTSVKVTDHPAAESNSAVCVGQALNLKATSITGSTYTWTGPSGFTSSVQNPSIQVAALTNVGVYTLSITGTNACTGTATTKVVVNPLPTATATSSSPICEGSVLLLKATGSGAASWTGPQGNSVDAVIIETKSSQSGIYTLTVKSSTGCTATATTTVVINPKPVATATSNSPITAGNTINLTGGGGGSYAWTGPNGNGFKSSLQNPSIPNAADINAGLYLLQVTGTNGCTALASTRVIVTLPVLTTCSVIAKSNSPICVGKKIELGVSPEGVTAWIGPNGFSSTLQYPSIASAVGANAGLYTVSVVRQGCTATATVAVTVSTQAVVITLKNQAICEGAAVQLCPQLTSINGNYTFHWTGPSGFVSSVACLSLQNAATANNGTYNFTAESPLSCPVVGSVTVTVSAKPTFIASSNTPIVVGTTLNLSATTGADGYTWGGPKGFVATTQAPSILNTTTENAGIYTVKGTFTNGCTVYASTEVKITPTIATAVCKISVGNTGPVCAGKTLKIYAQVGSSGIFNWSGPGGFTSKEQIVTFDAAKVSNAGTYTVNFVSAACTATATVAVTVKESSVPTATNNSPVCAGESVTLSATGGGAYSWDGVNTYRSTTQNPVLINASPGQSGVYIVSVTGTNGCIATATTAVKIKVRPQLTADSNTPIITSETLALFALTFDNVASASYAWKGPNAFTSSLQKPTISNATALNGGVYTVVISGENICSASATTSVMVIVPAAQSARVGTDLSVSRMFVPTFEAQNSEATSDMDAMVYPNPTNGKATLEIYLTEASPIVLKIADLQGKTLDNQQIEGKAGKNQIGVSVSEYPAGTYYLMASTPEKQIVKKIVRTE